MFTLGLHNHDIIAFNLVTHIVYCDTTTEKGQAMLRGESVHASPGDLQQSRKHYLQLGDRLQLNAMPDFLYMLIYWRTYPKPPKINLLFWILHFFSFVDPPYFWDEYIKLSSICGEKLLLFDRPNLFYIFLFSFSLLV